MAKPIKIIVAGKDQHGSDAPTVMDLLDQVRDILAVLTDVDGAISDQGRAEIEWRVTDVSRDSPLSIEMTPFAVTYGMNIDNRAAHVIAATSSGFRGLCTSKARPAFFAESTVGRIEAIAKRVTNGLSETTVDCSAYPEVPDIRVSRPVAQHALKNIEAIKEPEQSPYIELGSVEGFVYRAERDGHGRPILWIDTRVDNERVKCVAEGAALNNFAHIEVGEIWKGLRVRVFGELRYKALGVLDRIVAEHVQFFDDDKNLPDHDDIVDPNFTNGVESVEYLKRLRENGEA